MKNIYFAAVALAVLSFSACSSDSGGDDNPSSSSGQGITPSSSSGPGTTPSSSSGPSTGGSGGACYMTLMAGLDLAICIESETESITAAECAAMAASYSEPSIEPIGEARASCPAGQKEKCDLGEGYAYIYGESAAAMGISCNIFEEDDEEDDE